MKSRNSLVSNSSSSNFIIAIPKDKSNKVKLTVEVEFSGDEINTIEELEEHYLDDDGHIRDEDQEEFDSCKKAIEKGKRIIFGSFGDQDDNPLHRAFCYGFADDINDPKIEVIQDCDGY